MVKLQALYDIKWRIRILLQSLWKKYSSSSYVWQMMSAKFLPQPSWHTILLEKFSIKLSHKLDSILAIELLIFPLSHES